MSDATWKDVAIELIENTGGLVLGAIAGMAVAGLFAVVTIGFSAGHNVTCLADRYTTTITINGKPRMVMTVEPAPECMK